MRAQVAAMAKELGVIGLMNTQLAYQDGEIYVIEVNPRASRTVPFVSKCVGTSLAAIAAKVMMAQFFGHSSHLRTHLILNIFSQAVRRQ